MEYREFRVIVQNRRSVTGYKQNGPPIPGSVYMDELREQTIKIFSRWLAENKANQREEFEVLGSHLYEALFGNINSEVRRAFEEEFKKSQKKHPFIPLRLVLEFTKESRDLADLPWEYLYYLDGQGRGFFIAAHTDLILARNAPIDIDLDTLNIGKGALCILVVVSKPEYEEVQEEQDRYTEDNIQRKLLGSIDANPVIRTISGLRSIETSILDHPTRSSLRQRIKEFKPHVVHFIAHGRYRDQKGELALIDEENQRLAEWIDDAGLADCFMRDKPGLIFLHACEGARSESYQSFKGLALQLIYSKIPAVVAMQYAIGNGVANDFAVAFYQSLSEGKSIDAAVQDGRIVLGTSSRKQNYSDRSFGSPIIYLQKCSTEIVLIEAQEQQEPYKKAGTRPLSTTSGIGQCPNCEIQTPKNKKFCHKCATRLAICVECGSLIIATSRICGDCGSPVNSEKVSARVDTRDRQLGNIAEKAYTKEGERGYSA